MPRLAKWIGDAMEGVLGSKMPMMEVVKTEYVNSSIKKITFKGNLNGMNFHLGCAIIIRINETEFRNYTPSFSDVERGVIEIIIHIHGNASGSNFMDQLKVGDKLRISAPRGQKQYVPSAKRYLIFGDETVLGLMVAFQPILKANGQLFELYIELEAQNKDVPTLLGLEKCKVFIKGTTFKNEETIANLPILNSLEWKGANFILAGNVNSVQAFRKALKSKKISGTVRSQGFWLEGKIGL